MKDKVNVTQEQFDQWLVDLRSGELKQGKGALCTRDRQDGSLAYCCLGVLAEGLGKLKPTTTTDLFYFDEDDNDEGRTGYLPPTYMDASSQSILACKNDVLVPFSEIADYIEKNLEPTNG
jgi:hypothetical protein